MNTIQFPASDLTLIPIPAGVGRYAGLLSFDVRPSLPVGKSLTVSVRQLNHISFTNRREDPPPRGVEVAVPRFEVESVRNESFSWRKVQGAFQYTVTVKPEKVLLSELERLVGWLKWRVGVTPGQNRWLPVLKRYLKYTETVVWTLGKDPHTIPPSEGGNVPGAGTGHPHPILKEHECTGKVVAIHYDRFGDFCGFLILTEAGDERAFLAQEHAIETLVRQAWVERTVVRVFSDEHDHERLDRLVLLRYH